MIVRFREVVPGKLYRGSAPTPDDVASLHDKLGIRKIVSLDEKTGDRIERACQLLGIRHVKEYLMGDKKSLLDFLSQDPCQLFLQDGPTFVHCYEGKDRTGLAVALVQVKCEGMDPERAIEEAKSLGFGLGIPPEITNLYEKIIRAVSQEGDANNSDNNHSDSIVANERQYIGDSRDSFLDEAHQGSFAPYLDHTRHSPMDAVYNFVNDQGSTRQDYPDDGEALKSVHDFSERNVIPENGVYDNDAGVRGFGPVEPVGGFIYAEKKSAMIKKAYAIQMSYNVSDAEKQEAEQALLAFKSAGKLLMQASDHLNVMKTPFKDSPNIPPEDVMKARAVVRRFRDKAIDNFNLFKRSCFQCVNLMRVFSSDTQTLKLMKSLITAIDQLEASVNDFSNLFTDLQDKDFTKNVVVSIENIQQQCDEIDQIIDERIKSHIQENILATSWVDAISNDLQVKIEQKTPLIMDLYNQRQQQLNQTVEERGRLGN